MYITKDKSKGTKGYSYTPIINVIGTVENINKLISEINEYLVVNK
jgi:hypothetical protein